MYDELMNENDQTVAGYDKTIEKYVETSPQIVTPELQTWIDKNLTMLPPKAKILEIGSGSGKDADYFKAKGFDMELTDASQGFVDYLNSRGKKARLLNALMDDLGTGYDMVFADAVLLHFTPQQMKKVLRKIYSALNIKGRVVFSLKIGQGEEITERKLEVPRYFCYWNEIDITERLTENSFVDIAIETIDDYRGKARHGWLLIDALKI